MSRSVDVHPDGERFAVAGVREVESDATHDHVALILNLFDEPRRIAPPAKR
jgi:hypothetical protein